MKNCNKYSKKALLGAILMIISLIILPISGKENFEGVMLTLFYISKVLSPFVSILLALPYIKCLSENNKKLKSPFSR